MMEVYIAVWLAESPRLRMNVFTVIIWEPTAAEKFHEAKGIIPGSRQGTLLACLGRRDAWLESVPSFSLPLLHALKHCA